MAKSWRELVCYPNHVPADTRETLDALGELCPPPDSGNRFVDLADFLRNGEVVGLITDEEHHLIRRRIGPHM